MSSFPDFWGNEPAAQTLRQMIESGRISQTILLSGPEGVGKATLTRRFAAALLGSASKIEQDDLSLPQNVETADQRADLVYGVKIRIRDPQHELLSGTTVTVRIR